MIKTKISILPNFKKPPLDVTINDAIKWVKNGTRFTPLIRQYQQTGNKAIKQKLPAFIFGAVCKDGHSMKHVKNKTGWVSLDFDSQHNPKITDWPNFRDQLIKIKYVYFSALSVSGKGAWCLIKVSEPDRQKEHFNQVIKDFEHLGIYPDTTKGINPNDKRFLSYDPEAKLKERFSIYNRFPVPVPEPKNSSNKKRRTSKAFKGNIFERGVEFAKERGYTFTRGCKKGGLHYSILVLAGYLNYYGVPKHEAEAWIKSNITPDINSNCISWPYEKGLNKFGEGKRLQSKSENYQYQRVDTETGEVLEAPYGMNPFTGEIFDERGYPASWDMIEPPQPGTAEYSEMIQAEYSDSDSNKHRAELLAELDPKVSKITQLFDAVPI